MQHEKDLTDGHVILEPISQKHCTQTYVDWLNDPITNRFLESRWFPQTLESVNSFVNSISMMSNAYMFAILDSDKKHIGNIKIDCIHPVHKNAWIGYMIGDVNSRNKGYVTSAIKLISDFAFSYLNLHKVSAGVSILNTGSAKALLKSGFTCEYTSKSTHIVDHPNMWEDARVYTRFQSDILNPKANG